LAAALIKLSAPPTELELARDLVRLLTGPDLTLALVAEKALEHLDAARLRLVGTAAGCTPPKDSR
jgi:hypothetical protein